MNQDTTEHLGLPLPHPNNRLQDDVLHLREAMHGIDRALYQHSQATTALGESVQDITPEITAQLQAQTQALGNQMQAGTQAVTEAVATQAQATTQALGTELTAQAQAIQTLADEIATRASAQQLQAAFAAQEQFMGAAMAQGSHNFPIVKIFTESGSYIFPCPGTIFMRAVGAGAGAGAKEGGSGGWGQGVKNVQLGDQITFAIGAGGVGGYSWQVPSSSAWDFRVAHDGGDTIVTLRGEEYRAAGGAGQSERFVTDGNAPKPSTGPWDYSQPGGAFGKGTVDGLLVTKNALDSLMEGWGVKTTDSNTVLRTGGLFSAGSRSTSESIAGGDGGAGGAGGGGGGRGYLSMSGGEIYSWRNGGTGGNGILILYFWPQTNP